jgi:hypothetical protein
LIIDCIYGEVPVKMREVLERMDLNMQILRDHHVTALDIASPRKTIDLTRFSGAKQPSS